MTNVLWQQKASNGLRMKVNWCGIMCGRAAVRLPTSPPRKVVRARTSRTCRLQPIGSRRFDQVTRQSFLAGNGHPTWHCVRHFAPAASRGEVGSIPAEVRHPSAAVRSVLPSRRATASNCPAAAFVCIQSTQAQYNVKICLKATRLKHRPIASGTWQCSTCHSSEFYPTVQNYNTW